MMKVVVLYVAGAIISWIICMVKTYLVMTRYCGWRKERFMEEMKANLNLKELLKVMIYIVGWPILSPVLIYSLVESEKAFNDLKIWSESIEKE